MSAEDKRVEQSAIAASYMEKIESRGFERRQTAFLPKENDSLNIKFGMSP